MKIHENPDIQDLWNVASLKIALDQIRGTSSWTSDWRLEMSGPWQKATRTSTNQKHQSKCVVRRNDRRQFSESPIILQGLAIQGFWYRFLWVPSPFAWFCKSGLDYHFKTTINHERKFWTSLIWRTATPHLVLPSAHPARTYACQVWRWKRIEMCQSFANIRSSDNQTRSTP